MEASLFRPEQELEELWGEKNARLEHIVLFIRNVYYLATGKVFDGDVDVDAVKTRFTYAHLWVLNQAAALLANFRFALDQAAEKAAKGTGEPLPQAFGVFEKTPAKPQRMTTVDIFQIIARHSSPHAGERLNKTQMALCIGLVQSANISEIVGDDGMPAKKAAMQRDWCFNATPEKIIEAAAATRLGLELSERTHT